VAKVLVRPGEGAAAGRPLFLLQSMKMEFEVAAPRAGRIAEVRVREGDEVEVGEVMATLDAGEPIGRWDPRSLG
jgi:oxaloacetate decarboxylase alpha subunit